MKKNSVVTGIEPTTSGLLLDQRRSRSDNQAPFGRGAQFSYYVGIEEGMEKIQSPMILPSTFTLWEEMVAALCQEFEILHLI